MKIAISASGQNPEAAVEPRFGRAAFFLLYDDASGTWSVLDNADNRAQARGAGIQTAEHLAANGVSVIITGFCGPKAHRALAAAGIKIMNGMDLSAEAAVEKLRNGELQEIAESNAAPHWK